MTAAACSLLSGAEVVGFPFEVASTRIRYDAGTPSFCGVEAGCRRGSPWSAGRGSRPGLGRPERSSARSDGRRSARRTTAAPGVSRRPRCRRASSRPRPASGRPRLTKVSSSALVTGWCRVPATWRNSTISGAGSRVVARDRGRDQQRRRVHDVAQGRDGQLRQVAEAACAAGPPGRCRGVDGGQERRLVVVRARRRRGRPAVRAPRGSPAAWGRTSRRRGRAAAGGEVGPRGRRRGGAARAERAGLRRAPAAARRAARPNGRSVVTAGA